MKAAGDLCKNPQYNKDPDSVFVLGQPGKREPPVRKSELPSRSGSLSQHDGNATDLEAQASGLPFAVKVSFWTRTQDSSKTP
jgi:hypothetical protein